MCKYVRWTRRDGNPACWQPEHFPSNDDFDCLGSLLESNVFQVEIERLGQGQGEGGSPSGQNKGEEQDR